MRNTTITCFQNIQKVSDPKHIKLETLLERFKKDSNGITAMQQKEDFKTLKRGLPIACFGGTFNHRSKNGLIKHSKILVLDFDNVKHLGDQKKKIVAKKWVISCFVSPSGKGLKALVRIPECKSDLEYKEYFTAIKKIFPEIDDSGKDISRACFFAFDPEIYINYDAATFTEKVQETKAIPKMTEAQVKNDYKLASRILDIVRHATVGERHDKILKASRLMGGYVASNKISQQEAIRLLEQECNNIAPHTPTENLKTIIDGLENGLLSPLHDCVELKQEETEMKLGKIYFTANDKSDEIDKLWSEGRQKGYELSFQNTKDKISVKLGCTTFIYGAPYSGKSQIWFEYLVDLSVHHGLRHAIYSPETGKAAEVFIEIMTIYMQKDFYQGTNRMTTTEKDRAKEFIDRHFIVIDPDDGIFTIEDFWSYIDIVERVFETEIHTTCADPFNEFAHDYSKDNNRQDSYLERVLGANRRNARTNNRHNCLITHVQNIQQQKQGELMFYPPATPHQIAGGQAWFRKGEQMLSCWRPKEGLNDNHGNPYEKNQLVLIIQKSKPKGIGETGSLDFFYDVRMHSYYEEIAGIKFFAKREKAEEKKPFPVVSHQESIYNFENEFKADIGYPPEWD